MLSDRFRLPVAVYGVLVQDGRVLLMRRAGSGYRDGQFALPAGHLDRDEDVMGALVRECSVRSPPADHTTPAPHQTA